jgi:hypothetical protein
VTSFILLYNGPATPPDATHDGWPEWFQGLGDDLVDLGSPMAGGFVVHPDGSTSETPTSLNGYSVVRANDRDELLERLGSHPLLAPGSPYTVEVFEVPRKS